MGINITIRLIFLIEASQNLKQKDMLHDICKVTCMEVVTVIHVSIIPKINEYFSMKNSFVQIAFIH